MAGSEDSAGDAGTSESTDAAAGETPGAVQENTGSAETADFFSGYTVHTAPSVAAALTGEGMSDHAVLINANTGEIVAGKNWEGPIVPASMTKILTVLVAAEHLGPAALDEPFTVTIDDTDYSYRNDGSAAGFEPILSSSVIPLSPSDGAFRVNLSGTPRTSPIWITS